MSEPSVGALYTALEDVLYERGDGLTMAAVVGVLYMLMNNIVAGAYDGDYSIN